MTEKTEKPAADAAAESLSEGSDNAVAADDKVGPGRPPRDTRWKKGGPSPNPRGRPRKEPSMLPDARKAFERALNKKVPIPRGDKQVMMTRIEIGLEQLLNQFAKGDRYARRDLMEYADKLGIDFLAPHRQVLEQALSPNYQAILDAALARRSAAADLAPAAPVLAPAELLDDDVNDVSAADATLVPAATAATNPHIPDPEPVPGMQYPKPFKQMTPRQRMIYYPDWWAQYGELWEKCGRP